MALVIVNKTQAKSTPASNSITVAHNQNVGDDGYLLVAVTMTNSVDFSGATYDGAAMTQLGAYSSGSLAQRFVFYGLEVPATGSKNVKINFSASQWNPVSIFICSFTGSGGAGAVGINDLATSPHSRSLTVAENSVIYAMGISTSPFLGINIDGADRPAEFNHNIYREVFGVLSATGVANTSRTVITKVNWSGAVTNYRVEIKEAGSGGGGKAEGNFLVMF